MLDGRYGMEEIVLRQSLVILLLIVSMNATVVVQDV